MQFFQNVMEIFVWLEVMPDQVELKCAIITHGGQCVMMDGVTKMLKWCADNLDYQRHVSISTKVHSRSLAHGSSCGRVCLRSSTS